MAEENNAPVVEPENNSTPNQADNERRFTQSDIDKIVKQRLERERAKHSDDLAAAESRRQEAEEALQTATQERDALKAEKTRREMVEKVASEVKLPYQAINMLQGATVEELKANAEVLRASMPMYPVTTDSGTVQPVPITREQIDAIKDRDEREKMMLEHLDLYK